MLWARITFGVRSFHASAKPTRGPLVTTGPYRFIRHPIYAAAVLFVLAGTSVHLSVSAGALAGLFLGGCLLRIFAEERLLLERYADYAAYVLRTKRIVPYCF